MEGDDQPAGLDAPTRHVVERWRREADHLRRLVEWSRDAVRVNEVRLVAGMDLSFVKDNARLSCACIVVSEFPACEKIVYEECRLVELTQPYVSGFLAFREADFLVELLDTLRQKRPDLFPQVVLIDGNGMLHPQRIGLACHVGVRANVCAIGVAKTFLQVDALDWGVIKVRRARPCYFATTLTRRRSATSRSTAAKRETSCPCGASVVRFWGRQSPRSTTSKSLSLSASATASPSRRPCALCLLSPNSASPSPFATLTIAVASG